MRWNGWYFLLAMKTASLSTPQTAEVQGRHFYQFYKGRDDFFHVVIPFLIMGLENQEACLWVVSRSTGVLEAVEAFQRIYDLNPFIESGQLVILPTERWYLDRGRFSTAKTMQRAKKFVDDKERRGFKAFREVGDLGWLEGSDWGEFQSYEKKTHQWIQKLRMIAICAYPIHHCSVAQAKDILDHHDRIFQSHPQS